MIFAEPRVLDKNPTKQNDSLSQIWYSDTEFLVAWGFADIIISMWVKTDFVQDPREGRELWPA